MTTMLDPARGSAYAGLSREIKAAGLLDRRRLHYAARISLTLLTYIGTWVALVLVGDSWYTTIVAAVMGIAFTQVAFLGHDGGHQQIAAKRGSNDLIGLLAGNLLTGLSIGWWVGKHNKHHSNPNKEHHDPDIGEGVLAFTTGSVARKTGGLGRAITKYQAFLFFPLLTLEGFNLHVASGMYLRTARRDKDRAVELALLTVHIAAYLGGVFLILSPVKALVFIAIHQGVFGLYMGCSFAPNHKGMRIIGPDECLDFLRRQVLTSRNVRGGRFTDNLLGGLNYQIEHHLFPSMPRPSLRHAQALVRAYCHEHMIDYTETSLFGSYAAALTYLHELGGPLRNGARTAALASTGG
jgi:fatty acid desaturase